MLTLPGPLESLDRTRGSFDMAKYFGNHRRKSSDDPPPSKITGQALRDARVLLAYLVPYRHYFVAALVALLCSSLLALSFPFVAGNLVDAALTARSPEGAFWQGSINQVALTLVVILAVQAAFTFGQTIGFATVSERSLADLRRDAYAHIIRLPMAFFSQQRVGELTSRIASDLALIQDTLMGTLPHLLRQMTLLSGGVVLIFLTSARLALVMLATIPVLIGLAAFFGRFIRRAAHLAQDQLADSNVIVEESLQGVQNVKAFGNEGYEVQRYRSSIDRFVTSGLRGARYRAAFVSFIVFALFGGLVLVLWYGAGLVQAGDLSAGELTRFLLYTMFVGGALGTFAELYGQLQRALGASQRIREILRETPEPLPLTVSGGMLSRPSPATPDVQLPAGRESMPPPAERMADLSEGRPSRLKLAGQVEFERVSFRYPSRPEVQVLRDVSLIAQAGERVALVGPSGAGKSTIVALLLRFYEPETGRILIDGRDARTFGLAELRGQMAVVPQEVILFGGTVAENIAYGRPGASEAEIEEAARKANAHDFISRFPDGYQTRVGDRGIQLSGGQRQRVAIARAILKNPAILILDEATSSLDSESESLVQQALESLMHGRTSFIIAHRLATVRTADRIFVIKDGATVESGTHEELIDRENGLYRTLSELQFDLR